MQLEWDESKRLTNIRKHAIDFVGLEELFEGDVVTNEDTRAEYGEQRYLTIGMLNRRVIVVAHTERGDLTRIISARKATQYEEKEYFTYFAD